LTLNFLILKPRRLLGRLSSKEVIKSEASSYANYGNGLPADEGAPEDKGAYKKDDKQTKELAERSEKT